MVGMVLAALVAPAMPRSLWLDEVSSLLVATSDSFWPAMRRYDHPPLYFAFLRLWAAVSHDEVWLRLPSLLAMALATAATVAWARRLDVRAGPLAAGLALGTSAYVRYAAEVRDYAPLALLTVLAGLATERAAARSRRRDFAALAALLAIAAWTHAVGVLLAPPLVCYGMLRARALKRPPPRRAWALALAVPLAAAAVWLFAFSTHAPARDGWWMPALSVETMVNTWLRVVPWTRLVAAARSHDEAVVAVAGSALAVAVGLAIVLCVVVDLVRRRGANPMLVPILFAMELSILSVVRLPMLSDRLLSPTIAAGAVGAALAVVSVRRRWLRTVALTAAVITAVGGAFGWLTIEADVVYEDWRGAAKYVADLKRPDDAIIVYPHYVAAPLRHYLPADLAAEIIALDEHGGVRAVAAKPRKAGGAIVVMRIDAVASRSQETLAALVSSLTKRFGPLRSNKPFGLIRVVRYRTRA